MADHMGALGVPSHLVSFDYTVVRGLGYYTGPIFETVISEPNLGSISGGGRYDGLIGLFRKTSLPTTGVSLGIERIIDLMDMLGLYPPHIGGTLVEVLVTVFNEATQAESTRLAAELRRAGIKTELYMDDAKYKLGKQFAHADQKQIPLVAVLGDDEIAQGMVKLKRLRDGHEQSVPRADAAAAVRQMLL